MNIKFKWIGGASWILQFDNVKIACDPVLCPKGYVQDYKYFKTVRLNQPMFDEKDFLDINLWLLTHNHEDHLDKFGFDKINNEATIVLHKSLKSHFEKNKYKNAHLLSSYKNMMISINDINIKIITLPAIHSYNPLLGIVIGNGNSYFLEITKHDLHFTVYITGDSVFNKNLIKYFKNQRIDLIIANAGSAKIGKSVLSTIIGRITNNISDIKKLTTFLKPKLLIPVHWGTFSHYYELITKESFIKFDNVKIADIGEIINLDYLV